MTSEAALRATREDPVDDVEVIDSVYAQLVNAKALPPAETGPIPLSDRIVSRERLFGSEKRWRRFGKPTPAGGSLKADGTPDYGVFGPGSVAWDVLLHPATIFLQFIGQQMLQTTYKPIAAGVRDRDPISRKGQDGTLTMFDAFHRAQRNSGIHAPMWLGDTPTAERVARHLQNIHSHVAGDIIDVGAPELGGYAANAPREAMWAALTEMHSMLWIYEAFAFRGGWLPRRLKPQLRDRFIAETADYVRLFCEPEDELPTTMAELKALYGKHDALFGHSATIGILPNTGEDFHDVMQRTMKKNFHISQLRVLTVLLLQFSFFAIPVLGALSPKTRQARNSGPIRNGIAIAAKTLLLPLIWVVQQRPVERYFMRLMWGPDAIELIESARRLHNAARKELGGSRRQVARASR